MSRMNQLVLVAVVMIQQMAASACAATTIQAVGDHVESEIIIPGQISGSTERTTTINCARRNGGDPQKATIDFYGEIPCDGKDSIINQGVTWPAHLTMRNYDTVSVILDVKLAHTGEAFNQASKTLQAAQSCSATLETSISLGSLLPGVPVTVPLTDGATSGLLLLKPSQFMNDEGTLGSENDVVYDIPAAVWNGSRQGWTAAEGKELAITAYAQEKASPGLKQGTLTATVSCP